MKPSLTLYVDGASKGNPGPASCGVVIKSESDDTIKTLSEYIGITTNNVAEYFGLILGLQESLHLQASKVKVFTDSQLMAKQFTGEYKTKEPHVKLLHRQVKWLARYFEECHVEYIPREQNKEADKLANLAIEDHI